MILFQSSLVVTSDLGYKYLRYILKFRMQFNTIVCWYEQSITPIRHLLYVTVIVKIYL